MSKRFIELQDRRNDELAAAKAITDAAEEENRDLTDEETAQIEAHTQKAAELKTEAEAEKAKEEKRQALKAELAAQLEDANQVQEPLVRPEPQRTPSIRQTGGEGSPNFRGFGEYLYMVREAARTPGIAGELERKIQAGPSGLSTTVDSEGGFLIPPQFSNEILQKMFTRGEILSRVRRLSISGNTYKVPYINESSRADGSRWGGVRAYWIDEGNTPTATKPDMGMLDLKTKKVACVGYVTDEQLEDAPATGSLLMDAFTDETLFAVENAIFQGTGAGQPLGLLNAACKVEVTKETNQTAATVWGPNVVKMWARCWARSRSNAVWLINQSVEPYLWGLTLEGRWGSETTSVDGVPLYSPANSVTNQGIYATLMGRPVIPVEYTKAAGTAGDIVLTDLSQYFFVDKGGPDVATSMHVRFLYAENTYRVMYRCDGAPWWASALTPYDAGDTLTPIVTLAARS